MRFKEINQCFCVYGLMLAFLTCAAAQPGTLDNTFGTGGRIIREIGQYSDSANDVVVQPNGKIVVVGDTFTSTSADIAVVRYNADGTSDGTFGFSRSGFVRTAITSTSNDIARAVALQADGKIVVAGHYSESGSLNFNILVVRYNPNGTLDTTFGGDGIVLPQLTRKAQAVDLLVQPDGKILVVGSIEFPETTLADICLLRFNADGSPDTSFRSGVVTEPILGVQQARRVALSPDNRIVVVGSTAGIGSKADFMLTQFDMNGNALPQVSRVTHLGDDDDYATGLAVQPDGKIVAAGITTNGSRTDTAIVRYNPNGTLDATFDEDGIMIKFLNNSTYVVDAAVQRNGRIVVAGYYSGNNALSFIVQRFDSVGATDTNFGSNNGRLITSFISGVLCSASALALQRNGKIVVVGRTYDASLNYYDFAILRAHGDAQARADFDGDGKTDLGVYRPSNGQWWYVRSSDAQVPAAQFGGGTDKPVPADYTGDGKADIAFYRPSTSEWFILRSDDASYAAVQFGLSGDLPAPADYDGDGTTDLAVFRPSSQTWFIQQSGGGFGILTFGLNGDRPVPADFDGDGKADIAVWRASNGTWWIVNSSDLSQRGYGFGLGTDRPVVGDYTGDGKADIAVWRNATGEWFFLRSEDGSYYSYPFGIAGDIPVPGDYDGDGRFDSAVFRPSETNWYVQRSTAGIMIRQFGLAADTPVPSAFVPN